VRRAQYVEAIRGVKVVIHGHDKPSGFDKAYRLADLFTDAVFFDALAAVTGDVTLVLWDLGMFMHCEESRYLKEYTKLKPLSLQAGDTRVVDGLAFYYSHKSIFRPFLYINDKVFHETLQEFYGVGVYEGYDGSEIESYVERVQPHIEMGAAEIPVSI